MNFSSFSNSQSGKTDDLKILLLKNYTGHGDWVTSLVLFPPKIIVSGSLDATIRIMWSKSGKWINSEVETEIIKESKGGVRGMIKWDDRTVLVCTEHSAIFALDIFEKKTRRFSSYLFQSRNSTKHDRVFGLLKLNDKENDLFVGISGSGKVLVISYSKGKIVKRLKNQKVFNWSNLELSKTMKDCFFLSVSYEDSNKVKLINYKTNEVVKEYTQLENRRTTLSICTFVRQKSSENKRQEILVVNGDVLFDVETSDLILQFGKAVFSFHGTVYVCRIINGMYLITGDDNGKLMFQKYALDDIITHQEEDPSSQKYSTIGWGRRVEMIHSRYMTKRILDIQTLSVDDPFTFTVVTSSISKEISIVRIRSGSRPLFFLQNERLDEMRLKDLNDRVGFLLSELASNKEGQDGHIFRVKVMNLHLNVYTFMIK